MELSQEQIDAILDEALPDVTASLKKSLLHTVEWNVMDTASKAVREHVAAWVAEEIIPEIDRQLTANREGLISVGVELGPKVVASLVEAMTDTIKKNLESHWERKQVFEALLK